MKSLALMSLLMTFSTAYAATCIEHQPGRARAVTTTFTILPGKESASLTVKECDMTSHLAACTEVTSLYSMEFRPTRLQIWDLQKLHGAGLNSLDWQETYETYTLGCPRCAVYEQAIRKVGVLTNDNSTICKTSL